MQSWRYEGGEELEVCERCRAKGMREVQSWRYEGGEELEV